MTLASPLKNFASFFSHIPPNSALQRTAQKRVASELGRQASPSMSTKLHLLPEFLRGRVDIPVYGRWLARKAAAHLKRDRKRSYAGILHAGRQEGRFQRRRPSPADGSSFAATSQRLSMTTSPPLRSTPTQPAGVPGGCGGSQRRIRACYRVGCTNHRIRVTQVVRPKHICASS